jgi:hypothetical protein
MLALFLLCTNAIAQNNSSNNLEINKLNSIDNQQSTELIYLQTNKGIYETGEDLWFKAYILDAQHFIPSGLSKTLYLQLMNEETRQVFWQEKYEITKRFADGHILLPDTLPEGNYLVMAFTANSFFNDSSEFESFRRIIVKKDMKPRVSIEAKFNQQSFGVDDTVCINFIALSEQSKPLYAEVTAELVKGNQVLENVKTITGKEGKAIIRFRPENTGPGLKIIIKAKHTNDIENIKLPVPFHKGSPIQFSTFPEGGYLVSGLKNKLAFKAVKINGEPVEIEGTLFENGDSLLHFKSVHAGMGSFEFTPDRNKKYHIKLNHPQSDNLWQLPEIQDSGITLHLAERDSNFLVFKVKQNTGSTKKVIGLRGQLRGNVYFFTSGVLKEELEIKVAQKDFPQQGIAEFTLLDSTLSPIAERLVYINSGNKLFIDASLTKEKYETREKAVLDLRVTDENGQPVVSHMGVTVFDKIYQNNQDPQNIFTHFYLSSQLKGRIYDPAYYFNKDNKNRDINLDLLLLTQGWRRYVWNKQDLAENNRNSQQVIFDGVKGKVTATKNIKKAPKGKQILSIYNPAKGDDKYVLSADSTGSVKVSPVHLKLGQGGYVYLKPLIVDEYEYKLKTEKPFDTIINLLSKKSFYYPLHSGQTEKNSESRPYLSGPNIIELGEVTIEGKQKYQMRDKYLGYLDSLAHDKLVFDYYCTFHQLLNCPFLDCKNTGYHVSPIEGDLYREYIGFEWVDYERGEYTIEESKLEEYHYPVLTEEQLLSFHNLTRIKGYYTEREFYQPNYDKPDSLNMIPDYRNTLLWAPIVLTDRNGEAQLEFFCSDIYTGFVGIIEGVSGDGKLGSETFEFKVLKTKPFDWEK